MRRLVSLTLVGIIALVAAVFLPRVFTQPEGKEIQAPSETPAAGAPRARGGAVKVMVHRVQPRTLAEKITANGTVLANESVELRSEIAGKVVGIEFEEGVRVGEGDVLLRTNDSELQTQLRQTLYRIELAMMRVNRQQQLLEQGSTAQDAFDSAMNEARVLEAEAELIRAQLEKTVIRAPFSGVIGLRMVSEGSYITPTTAIVIL